MERRLSEILLPDELKASYGFYHLRVMGGCLCLCFEGNGTVPPQTWMMKEYKVRSSWTKSFDFDNPYSLDFLPICFTRNGEILGHDSTKKLVRLNDEGKLLEHRTHWLPHCGVYRESLLSLPDDSENFTK
ncbi:F-box/kelch-repeat protein [Spatholobus suberectus]|nr:F-box/kelch-repeat protein [Spatholobus suberectus]